jgi:hypothetical protein
MYSVYYLYCIVMFCCICYNLNKRPINRMTLLWSKGLSNYFTENNYLLGICYIHNFMFVKVKVTLWLTVGQSVSMSWCQAHSWTHDQIITSFLSEICCPFSVGRPLWREDGSAVCSAITQWPESRRTHNHTLLSHLRLPQPGGPGSPITLDSSCTL